MSIDFTRVLKNFDGSEIMHGNTTVPFTLSLCAVNALVSGANDPNLSGDQQLKQYLLAEKIDGKVVDLTSEEISLIKERINKTYNAPLIAGQALKMLDPVQAKNALPPPPANFSHLAAK